MGFPIKAELIDYVSTYGLNPNVVLPLIERVSTEGGNGAVTAVTIAPTAAELAEQTEPAVIPFTATVVGTGGFTEGVTWSITGEKTGTEISEDGVLTLAEAQFAGDFNVTVKATSVFKTSVNKTVVVTCKKPSAGE